MLGLWLAAGVARADDVRPETLPHRPRIGLVLSGGGARGVAHLGVLKTLDEMHIPIDAVAGTSMGAVIGGLYASGMSGAEIEKLLSSLDWQDAFRDRPPRSELTYRRKEEEREYLNIPLGLRGHRLILPKGLIQGQKLSQLLRQYTLPVASIHDFDHLPVPFRAVATDLATGQAVILKDGDLTTAMRASISAPGVFAPVEMQGKLLVDGGLAKNLPIDVAREMGVDLVIVVDVGYPLQDTQRLESLTRVSNQTLALLVHKDSDRQRATIGANDVLISPVLANLSSYDFRIAPEVVKAGRDATLIEQSKLALLSVDEATYKAFRAAQATRRQALPVPEFVRVAPGSEKYARLITNEFGQLVQQPLDPARIAKRISALYGRGELETLDYQYEEDPPDHYGLLFNAHGNSWGPNYVRFGLALQDDFSGNSSFSAYGRLALTELNALDAETDLDLRVGTSPLVALEYYQPLSLAQRYFISPHAEAEAYNVPQIENQETVGRFRVRSTEAGLDIGREFNTWGELRAGVLDTKGNARITLGDPTTPSSDFHARAYFGRVSYDQMDSASFPRRGQALQLEYRVEEGNAGGERGTDRITLDWRGATSSGRNTLLGWISLGSTVAGSETNVRSFYELGGFLNLSGLEPESLAGPHYGIARAIYMRSVGNGGEGVLNVPGYVGAALEIGNVWTQRQDVSFGSTRKDAAIFFGADTYIGPAYLAVGYDQKVHQTGLYLFLGKAF